MIVQYFYGPVFVYSLYTFSFKTTKVWKPERNLLKVNIKCCKWMFNSGVNVFSIENQCFTPQRRNFRWRRSQGAFPKNRRFVGNVTKRLRTANVSLNGDLCKIQHALPYHWRKWISSTITLFKSQTLSRARPKGVNFQWFYTQLSIVKICDSD